MSTGLAVLSPQSQLPGILASNKPPVLPGMIVKEISAPAHEAELPFLPCAANRSIRTRSTTDLDHDTVSTSPYSTDAEDEHTLSAYGDISLGEVVVPPLPDSEAASPPSPLQSKYSQPHLRLKLRRPPMPKKRRVSYAYVPGPLPYTGGTESDARWPGSPRPFAHNPPWAQHQPLVAPVPVADTKVARTPTEKSGSSIERLVDELIPRSPSIKLSPPGSPASQVPSLPQETRSLEEKNGVRAGREGAAKLPSSPMPVAVTPQQNKPKEAPWRMRLPPRLPIPKWDM